MNNILMTSSILEITNIKKKTSAKLFKDLQIGDKLRFSTEVKRCGIGSRGRTYAVEILIENINTKEKTYKTFNNVDFIYDCFEFKEA